MPGLITCDFIKRFLCAEAYAEILGAPDLHLRAGSTLHLACQIRQSTEPPEYVFWYHEDRMINYDAGVQALTNSASNVLIVPDADKSHDGNYTCKPSNAVPAHINVHVLNATEGKTLIADPSRGHATAFPDVSRRAIIQSCQAVDVGPYNCNDTIVIRYNV